MKSEMVIKTDFLSWPRRVPAGSGDIGSSGVKCLSLLPWAGWVLTLPCAAHLSQCFAGLAELKGMMRILFRNGGKGRESMQAGPG